MKKKKKEYVDNKVRQKTSRELGLSQKLLLSSSLILFHKCYSGNVSKKRIIKKACRKAKILGWLSTTHAHDLNFPYFSFDGCWNRRATEYVQSIGRLIFSMKSLWFRIQWCKLIDLSVKQYAVTWSHRRQCSDW